MENIKFKLLYLDDYTNRLSELINLFPVIKQEFPNVTLSVCCDVLKIPKPDLELLVTSRYISYEPDKYNGVSTAEICFSNSIRNISLAKDRGCLCITSTDIADRDCVVAPTIKLLLNSLRIFFNSDLYNGKIKKIKVRVYPSWQSSEHVVDFFKRMDINGTIELVSSGYSDYNVVLNSPQEYVPKNEKTIVFLMEPIDTPTSTKFLEWTNPYGVKYFTNHNTEWHLSWSYSKLMSTHIEKTKILSTVISDMELLEGHRLRKAFVKYLDKNMKFDIYGRDKNYDNHIRELPLYEKDDAIFPYKYTMNFENTSRIGYFTEKIVDAILGECLCFYWGCPNISQYIDSEAYILLDITDHESSLKKIKECIEQNEWEKRIHTIKREKQRILNHLQMFPKLKRIISNTLAPHIPTYLINLKRQPEKLESCIKKIQDAGIEMYERFEAVDGYDLEWNEEVEEWFQLKDDNYPYIRYENNIGVFGCALSHIRLWEKFEKDTISDIWMVLEDDVVFNHNFASEWSDIYNTIRDDNWDICYLGFLFFEEAIKDTDIKINDKVYQLVKSKKRFDVGGTHCYVIRRSGVDKILNIARNEKISTPIDQFLLDKYDVINAYLVYPMLTDQDRNIPSSVQGTQKTLKGIEKGIEKIKL